MDLSFVAFVLLTALLIALFRQQKKNFKRLPPGPTRIPLIGNLHQILLAKHPYKKLSQWANDYGKLYTIQIATKDAVVISCPKLMKEIFGQFAATGKFKTDLYMLPTRGQHGIISTDGKVWQEQRNFAVRSLKQFGFGKRSLEPLIINEALDLVEWIKNKSVDNEDENCADVPVSIGHVLQLSTVNALWTIMSGERFNLENVEMASKMEAVMRTVFDTAKTGLMYFPWLKKIAPELSGYNAVVRATDEVHEFIGERFNEHRRTFKSDHYDDPRDLIDCYIKQMESDISRDPNSSFYGSVGHTHCSASVFEILMAGAETTASTITWMMFLLCQHPDVQSKLRSEVDHVIGQSREPCLLDKSSMPYLQAVILETMRYSSLVPVGLIHELLEDIQCEGYRLSKGLLLVPNLYHVHHSESIWGDPEIFRPERFLNQEKETRNLKENVIPFQVGKRTCLGESLAMDIMFLFGAKLIQNFEVLPDPQVVNKAKTYQEPDITYFLLPMKAKLVMKKRS